MIPIERPRSDKRGMGVNGLFKNLDKLSKKDFTAAESIQREKIQKLNMHTQKFIEAKHRSKCGK